jgi:4-hydroxy-2-oxoheptanedioate aldolase
MDMEHHGYSVETAANLMRAARVGTADILVRPAKGEFMRMGRMLEMGAQGVMYPRCDNAEEAREVIRWAKFAPLGKRGFDGGNPDALYCSMDIPEYVRLANQQTFIVIQLEEQSAIDQAERIAAVEGVDAIFFGPGDFTVLSGIAGQLDHPLVQSSIRKIADAARRTGKHWGMPCFGPEHARQLLDLGARFLCHGCDLIFVKEGLERIQQQFKPLGFAFQNQISRDGQLGCRDDSSGYATQRAPARRHDPAIRAG